MNMNKQITGVLFSGHKYNISYMQLYRYIISYIVTILILFEMQKLLYIFMQAHAANIKYV